MKTKVLATILCVAFAVVIISTNVFAADEIASGNCGDNLTWVIDSNGTLTISGTGEMMEMYDPSQVPAEIAPWKVNAESVKKIAVESGVTSISVTAFDDMLNLKTISISDTVSFIEGDEGCFDWCPKLESIIVDENNKWFSTDDGVLFSKDKKKLIRFPEGKSGVYTLPDAVEVIGYGAFGACENLSEVIIPDSVRTIENYAFYPCFELKKVVIGDGVTSVGKWAFAECYNLSELTIGKSVESIGDNAFGFAIINELEIPEGCKSIGEQAFYGCAQLKKVIIPKSVTSIGWGAFDIYDAVLSDVYYAGTQNEWKNIKIEEANDVLMGAKIHYGTNDSASTVTQPNETKPVETKPAETHRTFKDVKTTDWFYDAVEFVDSTAIMSGTSPNTFSPNLPTTRGMIVTILWRMAGYQSGGISSFTDVDSSDWYADPVAWASKNGIVSGYGDGRFGPDDLITREQLATILYRFAEYNGGDMNISGGELQFSDVNKVENWAKTAMQWACEKGLISGMGDNTLNPKGSATRAQVATILKRSVID